MLARTQGLLATRIILEFKVVHDLGGHVHTMIAHRAYLPQESSYMI